MMGTKQVSSDIASSGAEGTVKIADVKSSVNIKNLVGNPSSIRKTDCHCGSSSSLSCSSTCKNTVSFPTASTNTSSSFSFPAAAAKKIPHCVSLKKSSLARRGYKSFEDWNSDPNHLYIGRCMTHHIPGAFGSKWGNPFKFNKNK